MSSAALVAFQVGGGILSLEMLAALLLALAVPLEVWIAWRSVQPANIPEQSRSCCSNVLAPESLVAAALPQLAAQPRLFSRQKSLGQLRAIFVGSQML